MVLLFFLVPLCIFFFLPVHFRVYYSKESWDDQFVFEMRFLNGLISRKKEVSLIKPMPEGVKKVQKKTGRWLLFKKKRTKTVTSPFAGNLSGLEEFFQRYQHYGLGITLMTYFIPARYQRWLLVTEDLERKGKFIKFVWITRFGAGEAARTSILYGIFWGIKSSLLYYLHRRVGFAKKPEIVVIPDFQKIRLDMLFDCIFSVKLGYIIIAAFMASFRLRIMKGGVGFERASN